jgi:glycosyltransferase involved in cell wall biosynthesis
MVAPSTSETPEALVEQLTQAAADTSNLELLPHLPREKVLDLIGRSAAVVITSRYEGMPNVFLEAWARGVPVLTLNCDPDGIIEERGLGIAARGSWDRFVAGATQLLDGRYPRADAAPRARAYVEEVHSIDAVAGRWAAVLETAANGARTSRPYYS